MGWLPGSVATDAEDLFSGSKTGFRATLFPAHLDRGDQHLTIGLPAIISRYEQAAGLLVARVVVDREGMAAEFLV